MSRLLRITALFIGAAFALMAQGTIGSISGLITDPSGAIVPGAKLTLTNTTQGSASAREISSNGEGLFVFTPVVPGTYNLAVEMTGFKSYTQSNIVVNVSDRVALPAIAGIPARARSRSGDDRSAGSGVIGHVGIAVSATEWVQAPRSGEVVRTSTIPAHRIDRKSTRLNSSHIPLSRMPSSA